ncbi:MAG: iron ABC transporter permease [Clostridiales bacterium]|jgi:iron complex transport system permease protein|nr:iron ABC transporter permease [Clostridiales bacterium]
MRRFWVVLTIFIILFALFAGLNIALGSVSIFNSDSGTARKILWDIRLPRMFAGIALGGALALAGFLLQTFFNNPIAGPYVLGISSGSKLAVALVMIFFMGAHRAVNSGVLIFAAFAGAVLTMVFVLLAARAHGSATLIVSGVMIGYICSAITDFVVTFADDASIVNLHNWSRGSFSGTSWNDIKVMTVVVLVTSFAVFFMSKPIEAYQLGEGYAKSMGVNIKAFRVALVFLSSVLVACVTAFAGPISFVGIAVPHLVKSFLKTSKPILVIPMCFLGGAIFCLGCDLTARTAFSPSELSISSVTALIGAPVVINIMLRKKRSA